MDKEGRVTTNNLFLFAMLIIFTVALNSDWRSSSIIWWGSVAFFVCVFLYHGKAKLAYERKYTLWMISFLLICMLSIFWAASRTQVVGMMKSIVVNTAIIFMIRSYITCKDDVHRIIHILLAAITINAVYLLLLNKTALLSINTNVNSTANRLGAEGAWNANSIGMMMAIGFIFFLYYFRTEKKTSAKLLYGFLAIIMVFVALVTGSRKALITVLAGAVVYLILDSEGKRIRSLLLVIAVLLAGFYLVMEVPYFYSIIGWRMEAMLAKFTGVGVADHSTLVRDEFINAGIEVFMQHPVIGVGLDCFRIFNAKITGYPWYAHNNYVEMLADLGLVGFSIYYSGYLYLLKEFIRNIKDQSSTTKIFFAIFICALINGYGAVIYSDFLFLTLLMLMFAWFTTEWEQVY